MSVNGKHQQVNLNDVEPIPDDWKNVRVDLSHVPEEDKSANLEYVHQAKIKIYW